MKFFEGDVSALPPRAYDPKGKAIDDDVAVDTESGLRVLAYAGEMVSAEYHKALMSVKAVKPAPENKSLTPKLENKSK
jgi:hypothetical protein